MTVLHRGHATPFYTVVCNSTFIQVVLWDILSIAAYVLTNCTYCFKSYFFKVSDNVLNV